MRGLAVLFLSLAAHSIPAAGQVTDAVRTEIIKTEDAWRQARIDAEVALLERFYAKEARIQGMDGKVLTREAEIAMSRRARSSPSSLHMGLSTSLPMAISP